MVSSAGFGGGGSGRRLRNIKRIVGEGCRMRFMERI